jgi:hypothetical protein
VKKFLNRIFSFGIILSSLLFAGCMDILNQPEPVQVSPGAGRVLLSIGGAGPERTLAPSDTAAIVFTMYELSFEGPAPVNPVSVTENLSAAVAVDLPIGRWNIRVVGYTGTAGAYTPAAEGSVEVTVNEGANPPANITLGPLTAAGNGTFTYSISVIPEGATGSLIISPVEGGADQTIPLNGGASYEESIELPGGQYLVRVALENAGKYAGLTEVLHIYPGKAVELPARIYTITDFAEPVTELDLTSYFTAPAKDEAPQTTLETSQYTGTIVWTIGASTPLNSNFATGSAYRAAVTLSPKPGYTFIGVAQNSFEFNNFGHTGTTQIANDAGSNVVNFRFAAIATTDDDATLRALTVRRGNDTSPASLTLTPAFEGNITEYSVVFEKDTGDLTANQIQISGTTRNTSAAKEGELTSWTPVSDGDTAYPLTVTAADGSTTKTYTITVTMLTLTADEKNADLSSLTVDSGTLSPAFDPAVTAYSLTVFSPTITVRGTAEKAGIGATVSANSGTPQNLYLGQNTIPIVVTASGGLDTKTYTVTVTRKAPDALLSGLTVNQGILSPAFSSGRTAYTVDVPYSVSSITVTGAAKAAPDGATVSSNSGAPQSLNVGVNPIDIVVSAADTITTKTYTVRVTRAAQNSDATLASLSVDTGTLVPLFDPFVTSYTVTVNNSVSSITATGAAAQAGATLSANSGQAQALSEGATSIDIVVSAADTTTTKTYTIRVTRLGSEYIEINNEAQLGYIGNDGGYPLAGKYLLKEDLVLSDWTPIAPDAGNAFSGSFDGNGHTITFQSLASGVVSANSYLGIFGYVKGSDAEKAVIKNLTIISSVNAVSTHGTGQAIGLLAGCAEQAEISGITIQGTLSFDAQRNTYAGGIIGIAKTSLIRDNIGSLDLYLAGGSGGGLESGMYYNYAGGFVGPFKDGVDIINCHNSGNVRSFCTVASSQVFVGGIAGGSVYAMNTSYQGKIEDCSASGIVHGRAMGYWAWVGGIAGCIVGDGDGTLEKTTRIVRCLFTGTVSLEGDTTGYPYIGGITAYNYYGALISQSCFTGTVEGKGNYVGGIAGYNSQSSGHNSRVEDCWSGGTVNNGSGIVGNMQVYTYIRRCHSTAVVVGGNGIVGSNASVEPNAVTGCVSLNALITTTGTGSPRRIGAGTTLSNNLGSTAVVITNRNGPVSPSATTANGADGADTVARPGKAIYQSLGWDFDTVWKMGGDGYPVLQWQD